MSFTSDQLEQLVKNLLENNKLKEELLQCQDTYNNVHASLGDEIDKLRKDNELLRAVIDLTKKKKKKKKNK